MVSSFSDLVMLARSDVCLLLYDQVLGCRLTGGSYLNCDLSSCSSLRYIFLFKIFPYCMSYTKLMWSTLSNGVKFHSRCPHCRTHNEKARTQTIWSVNTLTLSRGDSHHRCSLWQRETPSRHPRCSKLRLACGQSRYGRI